MLNAIIVGASGYTGAELAGLLAKHPGIQLQGLYVSAQSEDAGKPLSQLYTQLLGVVDLPLQPLSESQIPETCQGIDIVLLATAHSVSHELAPLFVAQDVTVFDLSGAFRVDDASFYSDFYGFPHQHNDLLKQAVYGLAEWSAEAIGGAQLIAVPGCYPTASLTALKPLAQAGLIKAETKPVINATSGVSGAGRKASLASSFCEVSLNPYGVFNHRHQPEIATHLGQQVIFTPHLGNFKRGILATITVQLVEGATLEQVSQAYQQAYADTPMVRLLPQGWPTINGVANTAFCDLAWQQQGEDLIVVSAIDNLLKGAAGQAIQCINIRFGFAVTTALI